MSSILDQRKRAVTNGKLEALPGGDYDEAPNVSILLAGKPSADGKGWESPPHRLTLWLEGSLLKFVFTSEDDQPKLYGSTSGLSHGLAGIETAITTGMSEWKKPRPRK